MIVGIDEVGRGCWAGPLVAGAVILGEPIEGLKDSKKLSKRERERLTGEIKRKAVAIGLGWVWPHEIDEIGLTAAVTKAMREALGQIGADYDEVIIDGHLNFLPENPKTQAVIKADDTVPAVSAASIVAKVARDLYMAKIASKFPGYGFEAHVGYGTAAHVTALAQLGVSPIHRKSFKPIRAMLQ
ncbi:MAG: putative Ribonuclease [Candidatus Saccharibacteria bacterium]|nr:putative Ribonuclease [Candidatus Saccharibacteria bacterium]